MKKLYRPLWLVSLLVVTPLALVGCSGGGSSSRQSATSAAFTFSNVISPYTFEPVSVRGALRASGGKVTNSLKGNGVYSFFGPAGDISNNELIFNTIVSEKNGDRYEFSFYRRGAKALNPTVGTVYDTSMSGGGDYAVRRPKDAQPQSFVSTSGTITVTARSGSVVTLTLSNILFESEALGDDDQFTVSGTLTYDIDKLQTLKFDELRAAFKTMIQMWRERKGLLMGIVFNLILALKALAYMVLPFESAVPMDSVIYSLTIFLPIYFLMLLMCLFQGLPLAVYGYFRHKGQLNNGRLSALTVALCLTPFFAPVLMRKLVFEPRQLRTHCIICDGPDSEAGYYLVPPNTKADYIFPFRYVVK